MNLMSVFFAVMLYSAPAGLNLYIATSTALGPGRAAVHQAQDRRGRKGQGRRRCRGRQARRTAEAGATAKAVSAVAGRQKSLAERIQAWVQKKIEQGRQAEDQRPQGQAQAQVTAMTKSETRMTIKKQ